MNEKKSYTVNAVLEVWNDETGEKITVGPDADALDLVELRSYTKDGTIEQRFVFQPDQIPFLTEALVRYQNFLRNK